VKITLAVRCNGLLLLAVLFLPAFVSAQTQPATSYALTHAKIFTLVGAPMDDATLIIRDGKIAAVGPNVEIPVGAQVIDATGLQIYPGLFDSITQMGLREIGAVSATVDTAETGAYNPDVVAATAVLPFLRAAASIPSAAAVPSADKPPRFTSQAGPSTRCSSRRALRWLSTGRSSKPEVSTSRHSP
jgi:hypothetical protein